MNDFMDYIDYKNPLFYLSGLSILMAPLVWNIVGRIEYKTRFFTGLAGNKYKAAYLFAAYIVFFSQIRDELYRRCVNETPHYPLENEVLLKLIRVAASILCAAGSVFVFTSFLQLGITGTYLGDYFRILKNERVTAFPFNVLEHPMYNGSSMIFFGYSLFYLCPTAIILAIWSHFVYHVASLFEGPFTTYIYEERARKLRFSEKPPVEVDPYKEYFKKYILTAKHLANKAMKHFD